MLFSTVAAHRLGTAEGKSSSVTGIIDGIASVAAGLCPVAIGADGCSRSSPNWPPRMDSVEVSLPNDL